MEPAINVAKMGPKIYVLRSDSTVQTGPEKDDR